MQKYLLLNIHKQILYSHMNLLIVSKAVMTSGLSIYRATCNTLSTQQDSWMLVFIYSQSSNKHTSLCQLLKVANVFSAKELLCAMSKIQISTIPLDYQNKSIQQTSIEVSVLLKLVSQLQPKKLIVLHLQTQIIF